MLRLLSFACLFLLHHTLPNDNPFPLNLQTESRRRLLRSSQLVKVGSFLRNFGVGKNLEPVVRFLQTIGDRGNRSGSSKAENHFRRSGGRAVWTSSGSKFFRAMVCAVRCRSDGSRRATWGTRSGRETS